MGGREAEGDGCVGLGAGVADFCAGGVAILGARGADGGTTGAAGGANGRGGLSGDRGGVAPAEVFDGAAGAAVAGRDGGNGAPVDGRGGKSTGRPLDGVGEPPAAGGAAGPPTGLETGGIGGTAGRVGAPGTGDDGVAVRGDGSRFAGAEGDGACVAAGGAGR